MREETVVTESMYSAVNVQLPAFAVLILRHRAKKVRQSLSAVVESLLLDTIMMDELQAMAQQSPVIAQAAEEWFRSAVAGKK